MGNFYSGTSGLVLPVKNKQEYPEELREKSRLHFYSTLFNTIEVNSSFYKLPQKKTVDRWANEVTNNFRFTFKLNREITHNKELAFDPQAVKEFLEIVNVPQSRQGCLLIQFPGKLNADHTNKLKKLLKLLSVNTWKLAVEFRHESWYNSKTKDLLKQFNAACVIHDLRPFTLQPIDDDIPVMYIRFHGTEKNYRGGYSDAILNDYATRIKQWLTEGKEVYAYFNNTLGPAVQNLIRLNELV